MDKFYEELNMLAANLEVIDKAIQNADINDDNGIIKTGLNEFLGYCYLNIKNLRDLYYGEQ